MLEPCRSGRKSSSIAAIVLDMPLDRLRGWPAQAAGGLEPFWQNARNCGMLGQYGFAIPERPLADPERAGGRPRPRFNAAMPDPGRVSRKLALAPAEDVPRCVEARHKCRTLAGFDAGSEGQPRALSPPMLGLRQGLPHRVSGAVASDACGRRLGHSLERARRPISSAGTRQSVALDDLNRNAWRGVRSRVRAQRRFDARGCNAGHMHLFAWIPTSVARDSCACRRERPAVLRDTRGCSRGQMHLSCLTGASASEVRGPVLRNKSICHGGHVRPSTMTPGPVSVAGRRVSVSAALVPPDGCGCHREQIRLYRVTAAVVLVDRRACYACR
jgi:hypothetical protein